MFVNGLRLLEGYLVVTSVPQDCAIIYLDFDVSVRDWKHPRPF